eukprot:Rhum_TRINITY_DN237_c0_g1::Rhum_TRINITY_DN237_c0_g1_i1::g.878::m.878
MQAGEVDSQLRRLGLDLQRHVDGGGAVREAAHRKDVDTVHQEGRQRAVRDAARHLEQHVLVLTLHGGRVASQGLRGEVVEHDNVGTRLARLRRLVEVPRLHLHLDGKAAGRLRLLHGSGDGARSVDVVVLQHRHARQRVPVRVAAADEEAVLVHQAEGARCGLPGAGNGALPLLRLRHLHRKRHLVGDAAAARQHLQRRAFALQDPVDRTRHLADDNLVRAAALHERALLDEPLHLAAAVAEDGLDEGEARKHHRALGEEDGRVLSRAHDVAAHVERGDVVLDPLGNDLVERRREHRRGGLVSARHH